MKTIGIIIWWLMGALAAGAATPGPEKQPVEEGVSQELAIRRKEAIDSLAYELRFVIPTRRDEAIVAHERLHLVLCERQEIVLDFRSPDERVHNVRINGEACPWSTAHDHLLIPPSATRRGLNEIDIEFTAGSQALNRRDDYLYSLFVPDRAHTAFPCFDQPDLKASFSLTLELPAAWKAVSNGPVVREEQQDERRKVEFAPTEPLPTYLFAFAAGDFQYRYFPEHRLGAYYRETDESRVAQLPEIARQIAFAIRWQEEFTGMPYPFAKYDFVVLPGFQFGGMEHAGATFYNDNTLFLPAHPTPDEVLRRTELIAHETSHMWFGDAVTMKWFDDVWTKEVFANYFAAEITAPLFPDINHRLNWLKTYKAAAVSLDRTEGRTSIRQPLDNMRYAGLVYNTIIYNKAPVMMRRMVGMMGKEAFQRGIRTYLKSYQYGNATWNDLVEILDAETPADLKAFSREWVDEEYWPHLSAQSYLDGRDDALYGYLEMSPRQTDSLMAYWPQETEPTARQALLMTLYENYCAGRIAEGRWLAFLLASLQQEGELLTASTLVGYLSEPLNLLGREPGATMEHELELLMEMADGHRLPSVRTQLLRLLMRHAYAPAVTHYLLTLWQAGSDSRLSINDYMTLTYELAVRLPERAESLVEQQRTRIGNGDRLRQFEFVARAVVASEAARDSLFHSLSEPSARRIEPWTLSVLYYLNHPLRDAASVKYIVPALEWLPDIQRTGDIFFPANWCSNLLAGHRTREAAAAVEAFLKATPQLHPMLRKKVLSAAYFLQRAVRESGREKES